MPITRKLIKVKTGRRKCKQRVWRKKWKMVGTPGPAAPPATAGSGAAAGGGSSGGQQAPGAAPAATPALAPGTTRGPRPRIKTDKTEKPAT